MNGRNWPKRNWSKKKLAKKWPRSGPEDSHNYLAPCFSIESDRENILHQERHRMQIAWESKKRTWKKTKLLASLKKQINWQNLLLLEFAPLQPFYVGFANENAANYLIIITIADT